MRTFAVVGQPEIFDDDLRLLEDCEQLAVEKLVT